MIPSTKRCTVLIGLLAGALNCSHGNWLENDFFKDLDTSGVIVFEPEDLSYDAQHWTLSTEIDGFSGSGYLVGQTNTFNVGGLGKMRYTFSVDVSGIYQLNWKGRITVGDQRGEHNDAFARILDENETVLDAVNSENERVRNTTWYKVFMNRLDQWSYDSKNVDHVGIAIAWQLEADRTYHFEISVRSLGFGLDRVVLWNQSIHSFGDIVSGRVGNIVPMNDLRPTIDHDHDGLPDSFELDHGGLALKPGEDPDRDGLITALEYALGTNPVVASELEGLTTSGTELEFGYRVSKEATEHYQVVPHRSDNLGEWTIDGLELVENQEASTDELTFMRARMTPPDFSEPVFLRLDLLPSERE